MFGLIELYKKMVRKLNHIRLQPICVFCFHHVCAKFDENSMYKNDWMLIDDFKYELCKLYNNKYEFISLSDAYKHICKDWFRTNKYAVITFDDGYASLKEILPWLHTKKIPVTLFVSGKYLDGVSYRDTPNEKYLTTDEIFSIDSPMVEIGNHGWEHQDSCQMTYKEFEDSVIKNVECLSIHPRYVPFWAYTWGRHGKWTDDLLRTYRLVPVLVDGNNNYNDCKFVHRTVLC